MENQIVTIENIRGYVDENGTAHVNVEDIARGLGFTQTKNGVEYPRYDRINAWLREFGFPHVVGKGDYIPENMFYRLAMKANNEAAQKFQARVADEIIPSIRKHGIYATGKFLEQAVLNPDWAIGVLNALKEERAKNAALQEEKARLQAEKALMQPKADYYDTVLESEDAVLVTVIAKEYGMSGIAFNKMLAKEKLQYFRDGMWILYQQYADKGYTVTKTLVFGRKTRMLTCWTQRGREFLYYFLKNRGIVPVKERPREKNLFGGNY